MIVSFEVIKQFFALKMENQWKTKLTALIKRVGNFSKVNAPVASALHKLETATREGNVLDAKTHELISLAVAVTTRCDGCIAAHAAAAKKAGASKEEIAEALGISARTVEVHKARMLSKLEVDGVPDLVRLSLLGAT